MPKFFWFSYILWQFLLKVLFFLLFDCSLDVMSCLFVDFLIYVETAWSLMLKFSAIFLSNHWLLVFFILAVFKGLILLTTSFNFLKKSLYALFILWFLIVWECNFAQNLFVLIIYSSFKRSKWNLFVATYFLFLIFLVQKIIWWSDNPILVSQHSVFLSFILVNMWSIRVDVLGVTLVGDFINCLRLKVLQNSKCFFISDDTSFAPFIMFFFSQYWTILI